MMNLEANQLACEQLKLAFPSRVTGPQDVEYEEEICRNWYVGSTRSLWPLNFLPTFSAHDFTS